MSGRRPLSFSILAALAAGALVAAALPPIGAWPLAPLGLALFSYLLAEAALSRRALLGLCAGIGQFSIGCAWALEFTALGYVVLVAFEAVLVALAALCVPRGRRHLLGFAGALALLEWLRDSWPFGGMPLGGVALSQADGPLVTLARLGGPVLVAAGTALVGGALGELVGAAVSLRRGRWASPPPRYAGALVTLVGVVLLAVVGVAAPAGGGVTRRATVAAVQGGGRRGVSSLEVSPQHAFLATLDVLDRLKKGAAALVVCPENAVPLDGSLASATRLGEIAKQARRLEATLFVGVTSPVGDKRFVNEIIAFSPRGTTIGRVEKVHPVPFGEYVPFRSLVTKFANLDAVPLDVIFGHNDGVVSTPSGDVGVINSYEAFYAERGRQEVRSGAQLLAVETNTASYGTSQAPAQELAASRLQAVSTGRTLVQSATTGYSAVISSSGDVTHLSALGTPDVIVADLSWRGGMTLYDRFGDWWVLVLGGLALAGSWITTWRAAKAAPFFRRARRR